MANTAAVLGKLGAAPYFLGGTGSDEYGDYLCHYLQSCGVRTDYLFRQPEHSSMMLAVLDADGERIIFSFDGPNARLPQLESENDQNKALEDVINRISQDSLQSKKDQVDVTDLADLQRFVDAAKAQKK